MHAGLILSIGLLERLSFKSMEECVRGVSSGGGETFLTECLWRMGFAPTDPGFSIYRPSARLFDPFKWTGHDDTSQGHGAWEMTNRMKCALFQTTHLFFLEPEVLADVLRVQPWNMTLTQTSP